MSKMQIVLVLLALATKVFAVNPLRPSPSHGCQKIKGISGLPLTTDNVCDTRDACDIISKGAHCVSTALDRPFASVIPATFPTMTCSQSACSATSPPTGLPDVLQCSSVSLFGNFCDCPIGTTAVYTCGICFSPPTSTCFCCTG